MTTKSTPPRLPRWAGLLGLLLIPLLIVGGLFAANWGAIGRSHEVKAAIVNLDEPVILDGQYTPLGRQLTAALVDSDRETNLTWVLESESGAEIGLLSGEYVAAVTVPTNFSAAATSFSKTASEAHQAVVQVRTSPVAGIADATLGKVVAREAVDALNSTLTSTYLDQIYLGFNQMGDQFTQIADGAGTLSDGVTEFTDGIGTAAEGAVTLSDGTDQLATGLNTMSSQTSTLPVGLDQLADGLELMHGQTAPLPSQVNQLATGLQQTADGAAALAAGQDQLAQGVTQYVNGVKQLIVPVTSLIEDNPELIEAITVIADNAEELETGLTTVSQTISQIQNLANVDPADLENTLPESLSCANALGSLTIPDGIDPSALCSLYYSGLAVGIDQANQQLAQADLDGSLSEVLNNAQLIIDAAKDMQLPADMNGLATSLAQLSISGDELASAANGIAAGGKDLSNGITGAATGANQLATGLPALADGIKQSATGARQLADGVDALAEGISQTAAGANQLADGAGELADGLTEASDGGSQLQEGAKELADGLAEGQSQLPNYSDTDRTALTTAVTAPIDTTDLVGTADFDLGWASLLLVLALWIGALATFLVVPALAPQLRESAKSSGRLIAESAIPGMVIVSCQGVAIAIIGTIALQPNMPQFFGMLTILVAAGAAFALVNQALVTWLAGVGRLISVVFAVLGAIGLITSAYPAAFEVLGMVSPLNPAIQAIRAVLTESGNVTLNVLGTLGWLAIGTLAVSIVVLRSRTTTFGALAKAHMLEK